MSFLFIFKDSYGSCVLPTPAAGLTLTSTVASSGISSFLSTSIGPLTAPIMVYPLCEYVAEPSARCKCESVASGAIFRETIEGCEASMILGRESLDRDCGVWRGGGSKLCSLRGWGVAEACCHLTAQLADLRCLEIQVSSAIVRSRRLTS